MITSKEWYIMKILWKEKRCTLMEIVEKVQKETKWSKSTCATMVRRMTEKGVIGYEVKGKTKYFYPLVEKEDKGHDEEVDDRVDEFADLDAGTAQADSPFLRLTF